MKKVIIATIIFIFSFPGWAYKNYSPNHPVHVKPYYKKNGKHVDDYCRSRPHQYNFNDGIKHG